VVLAIGLTPPEGRDFTVCIPSVGMNAAGFLLMVVKPHLLDFKFITVFTTIGTAGVLTGLSSGIKPYYVNVIYTTLILQFAILYLYTNVLSPKPANQSKVTKEVPSELKLKLVDGAMVVAAFIGGMITANIGSGSDIFLYGFGVYIWNVALGDTDLKMAENKLTASSVVVMGLLSIVTACARGFTAGISMNVWYCLGACSWLVCWGAPLGSLFLTPELQMTLRAAFYIAACVQFGCFGGITIKSGIPSSSKRMSSTATWVLIICITIAVLIAAVAHYRIMHRRFSARGGVVPITLMGVLSRLIPVEKFGLKLTPTVTAGASAGISSTNDNAQPSSV